MNNDPNYIAQKVLEKVRTGDVHMHTKAYFIFRMALTALLAILTLAVSVWVVSFIFFSIHESGELFLLGFGSRGALVFLSLFPWLSLIVDLGLLLLLEWLLQGFKFGYRISLFSIFLGILFFSIVLGIAFNFLPVHSMLLDRADNDQLPILGEMYESIRDSHQDQGVFRGTVVSLQGSQFVIAHTDLDHDSDDGTRTVSMQPGTVLTTPLRIGERVYVLGNLVDGVIQARGIEELSPDQ